MRYNFKNMVFTFDIDGTLIPSSSNKIDKNVLELLQELAVDNKVIFASARPIQGIKNLIPNSIHHLFDYVSLNGAFAIINNTEYAFGSISKYNVSLLIQNFKNQDLWLYTKNSWYSSNLSSTHYHKESCAVNMNAKPLHKLLKDDIVYKAILISRKKDLLKDLELSNLSISHSNTNYIEINNNNVNKAIFLKQALIESERLCSFGDAENDVPLLKASKYPIAANSKNEHLKSISVYNTTNKYYLGIREGLNYIHNTLSKNT